MSSEPVTSDAVGAPDDGSTLCLSCGLCCSGAVFSYVPVEPDEVARVRVHLPVVEGAAGAESQMKLPCTAHDRERGCTVYADRPRVCAGYACKQLEGVRTGTIPLDEARARVAAIRELAGRLHVALPGGGWVWARAEALAPIAGPGATDERRRHAQTLLDLKLLELLVARDLDEERARSETSPAGPVGSPT